MIPYSISYLGKSIKSQNYIRINSYCIELQRNYNHDSPSILCVNIHLNQLSSLMLRNFLQKLRTGNKVAF